MQRADSRRNFVRIAVPARFKIRVRFADGREYPALDLSAYGIAFACDMSESARFSMAQSWPDVQFEVLSRAVGVRAKVVHLQSDAVPGKLKVGLEFSEISAEDVFAVSEFIARHSGLNRTAPVRVKRPKAKSRAKASAKPAKKSAPKKVKAKGKTKSKSKAKSQARSKPKAKLKAKAKKR